MTDFEYSAWASTTEAGGKRLSGTLRVSARALVFSDGTLQNEMPLDGLQMRRGGAGNRYIFFKNARTPSLEFYTSSKEILSAPALADNPVLESEVRRLRSGFRLAKGLVIAAILLLVLGLLALKPLGDFIVQRSVAVVPRSWEASLGEKVAEQLLQTKHEIGDREVGAGVAALTEPLLKAWPDLEFTPQFHVVDDPEVNAFALPGGVIFLNSGLLLRAETAEEVIGVIAHELAHASHRHQLRQIAKVQWFRFLLGSLFGDLAPTLTGLAENSSQFLYLKFSRDYEREADRTAFEAMVRANLNPSGLASLFEKLKLNNGNLDALGRGLALLSTHPDLNDRIRYIEEMKAAQGERSWGRVAMDFNLFQEQLRKAGASAPKP